MQTELSSAPASAPTRRAFLRNTGCLAVASAWASTAFSAFGGQARVTLPFDNGERELVAYPQKRPLIVLTSRPPQLETPFSVFNDGLLMLNDAFFVRYHWSGPVRRSTRPRISLRAEGSVHTPL